MKTQRKKTKHTTIRNGDLFCLNCGTSQKLPVPMSIPMLGVMAKQFNKEHKDCPPDWKQPEVDQSLPEIEKAKWWLLHGEHGTSSKCMFFWLCPDKLKRELFYTKTHPGDPDDFRRCYMLIKTIPEWKELLYQMKTVSPVWRKIIDNWDKLCGMLEEQMAGKKNEMWQEMEKLGC
ncbi:MAG: hypothetical protein PHT07_15060 [Paludibacter sp.]|nr:hypothetical protein [Paludibacter sp.]